MSRIYLTTAGDMLDAIAFDVYGDETQVIALFAANPGLINQPLVLPASISITLPELEIKPAKNVLRDVWS